MTAFSWILVLAILSIMWIQVMPGKRIIDRMPGSQWPVFARCRFSFGAKNPYDPELLHRFFPRIMSRFLGMNCSRVATEWWDVGHEDSNGNYSGIAGIIQRDEVDVGEVPFRSDFFGSTAGFVSPVGFSAEVAIISRQNQTKVVTLSFL